LKSTALSAIMYGARDLRLEERPLEAALEADQVYVETEVTALSTGTDLGNYLGKSTDVPGAPGYPRLVGYSNVGVVRAVGSGAGDAPAPGMRVFAMKPHASAYIARQSELLAPVPAGVDPAPASLAYLAQLGVAALRQVNYEAGERVAVVGLGVIGLAACGMARAMGADVTAVANSPLRAEAALRAGAHRAMVAGRDQLPADLDIVILTANPWAAFRDSVEMARYGGRIGILGFPGRGEPAPEFNPFDPQWFYGKQLTLVGAGFSPRVECLAAEVRFNLRRNLEFIFASLASGAVNFDGIISHRLPAAHMREAYELALTHDKSLQAAVFDWR
jgi:threonine dehydrogenase-like Zn-dependent dehydrogenase